MKFSNLKFTSLLFSAIMILGMTSCGDDEDLRSSTFSYDFNTGQVAEAFAYGGTHENSLTASIKFEELKDGGTEVTVTLDNTMDGETYNTHAHDMADAAATPNMTPYNESPNGNVFAMGLVGNGGEVSGSNTSTLSYDALTTTYDGFLVVHDPLQNLTTTDPTTYVILGVFGR